jgi:choline kinase
MASTTGLFSQVVVILGPHFEAVVQTLQELASGLRWSSAVEILCIKNPVFEATNNVFSLHLAREYLEGDILIHNSDVLIAPVLLKRLLLEGTQDAGWVLVDKLLPVPEDETKVIVDATSRVVEIGEEIPSNRGHGRYVGVCRFNSGAAQIFKETVASLVEHGEVGVFYTKAIKEVASRCLVKSVWTNGSPWFEIDTPQDFRSAAAKSREIVQQVSTRQSGELATVRVIE